MNRRDFERLRKLRELQRLGMAVAEDLHARARAEKDPRKLVELADTFLMVGEELRAAMALEARLTRELETAPADPAQAAARAEVRAPMRARVLARRRRATTDPRLAVDPPTATRH